MSENRLNPISVTPTIGRQTPKNEFGHVLSNTLENGIRTAGSLLGSVAGMPVISSAVSAVTNFASSSRNAATGVVNVGGGGSGGVSHVSGTVGGGAPSIGSTAASSGGGIAMGGGTAPAGSQEYLSQMRAEADRSMMMQMQMQQESREYNTLTNILKLRHDSAKAAINNIR